MHLLWYCKAAHGYQLVCQKRLWIFLLAFLQLCSCTSSKHNNNWAVLVSTSRYWHNYRHIVNTLSIYRTVKRLGIPDSNIILMLADDLACNPRNPYPAQLFNNETHRLDVYGQDVEVDYRGYELSVEAFVRVLTGRHEPGTPSTKRMLSNKGSNILIHISGHGGDQFVKFQDTQELLAQDIADVLQQMWEKDRYHEIMLMIETCQAATMMTRIKAPNVISIASSQKGESSWSYKTDRDIGLSLIDRFTYQTLDFCERISINSTATFEDLFKVYSFDLMESHYSVHLSGFQRPLNTVFITDFFGSVSAAQPISQELTLPVMSSPELVVKAREAELPNLSTWLASHQAEGSHGLSLKSLCIHGRASFLEQQQNMVSNYEWSAATPLGVLACMVGYLFKRLCTPG